MLYHFSLFMFYFGQILFEAIFGCNLSGFVSYCQSHLGGDRKVSPVPLPEN